MPKTTPTTITNLEETQTPKRCMIIVWKWADLAPSEYDFYDIYQVAKQDHTATQDNSIDEKEIQQASSEDIVIRTKLGKSAAEQEQLCDLVRQYLYQNYQVFLFLHRGKDHYYDKKEVTAILNCILADKRNFKCFLFGEGRDYLYFKTKHCGLLGETGRFMNERRYRYWDKEEGKPKVIRAKVADRVTKTVYRHYFNRVWFYYEHEFDTKIMELKTAVLAYLYPFSIEQPDSTGKTCLDYLKQADGGFPLLWRLQSFLGYTFNESGLKRYEAEQEQSFIFDDVAANLAYIPDALSCYTTLQENLSQWLFKANTDTTVSLSTQLPLIRNQFDELQTSIAAH